MSKWKIPKTSTETISREEALELLDSMLKVYRRSESPITFETFLETVLYPVWHKLPHHIPPVTSNQLNDEINKSTEGMDFPHTAIPWLPEPVSIWEDFPSPFYWAVKPETSDEYCQVLISFLITNFIYINMSLPDDTFNLYMVRLSTYLDYVKTRDPLIGYDYLFPFVSLSQSLIYRINCDLDEIKNILDHRSFTHFDLMAIIEAYDKGISPEAIINFSNNTLYLWKNYFPQISPKQMNKLASQDGKRVNKVVRFLKIKSLPDLTDQELEKLISLFSDADEIKLLVKRVKLKYRNPYFFNELFSLRENCTDSDYQVLINPTSSDEQINNIVNSFG